MSTTLVVMSSVHSTWVQFSTMHWTQLMTTIVVLIKLKLNLSFFVFSSNCFFFYCSRNLLCHRKDASKEGDETIVNHFHGVSSSSEAHRDVCGQTDPGSWILLDRVHVKWRSEFTVQVHRTRVSCVTQVGYRWYTHSSRPQSVVSFRPTSCNNIVSQSLTV